MKRKVNIILLIFLISQLFLGSCRKEAKQPNVLFILTDQWRASSLGYNGDTIVQTPNLDAFAREAVNFTNTVSVCPVCTPYRAALLTGRYPTHTGMFLNDIYLPAEELCMAEIYKEAGYQTAYLGKWHLDGHGRHKNVEPERRQGFEFWKALECSHDYNKMGYYENDEPEIKYWDGYSPYAISREAQRYMEENADNTRPFLLFVSIATPHFPHHSAPEEYMKLYTPEKLSLPANVPDSVKEKALKEMQGYYAHCTATDKAIGELIEKTKELGIDNNTMIVFTSDHGEMMGGHGRLPYRKQLAWDEAARVPFLIKTPGNEKQQAVTMKAPLTTPDILPSLLSLCNIKIPEVIKGYDLSELIKNPDPEADRAALYMNVFPFDVNFYDQEYRAIRTGRYTYAKTTEGPFMLFDNEKDPLQLNNLINKKEYSGLQAELEKDLDRELERIGDKDFKDKYFYLKKFNLEINGNNCVKYHFKKGEEHVVQMPKISDNS